MVRTKPTNKGPEPTEEELLEQAIAARGQQSTEMQPALQQSEESSYADPSQSAYAAAPVNSSPWEYGGHNGYTSTPVQGVPQHGHAGAQQLAQPPAASNKLPSSPRGCTREVVLTTLLSYVDWSLHMAGALCVFINYGPDSAERFWAIIIVAQIVALLGVVAFVSKASASTDGEGDVLQEHLSKRFEITGVVLIFAAIAPEILKTLTPANAVRSHVFIMKLDLFKTVLDSVPFIPVAINFIYQHGWGDRYWEWVLYEWRLKGWGNVTYINEPCGGGELGSGAASYLASYLAPAMPGVPSLPPTAVPPPPPPAAPYDETGITSYILLIGAIISAITIGLKVVRMLVLVYVKTHTVALQEQLEEAEKKIVADQEELTQLREHYNYYAGSQEYM